MSIKSTGSVWVQVRGHFLVKDGNKTCGFGSGPSFVPMGAGVGPFFSFTGLSKPDLFIFYKHDEHPKPDGCGYNFPPDSIPSLVGSLVHPNPTHCHP
jgi:hypothetical protein